MVGFTGALGSLAQGDPQQARLLQAVVSTVQEDGSLNLDYMEAIYTGIPCLDSPRLPVAGDSVAVLAIGGTMIVLGRYAVNMVEPAPSELTLEPAEAVAYIDGEMAGDAVAQARDPEIADGAIFSGGWFYSDDIQTTLAGVVPRAMYIYLVRDNEDAGEDRVSPQLFPHSHLEAPARGVKTVALEATFPHLERGQGRWYNIPGSWYPGFVSGAYRGIFMQDLANPPDPENYMTLSPNSGTISIVK